MRNAFIDELIAAAEQKDDIVLVIGDLGYGVVEPFARHFPKRFFNAGVAEQNMMGLSAGLASEGFHVFAYSIANFPTFRCAEQIRNDIAYHCLPVTIVAVGGGLAYGNLGYSHHAVQDYALIRVMPNMLIASPGDPMEVRACVRYLTATPRPSYLRLGKADEPCFHETIPDLEPGKWLAIRNAFPVDTAHPATPVFLSTGATMQAVERWHAAGNEEYAHYSLPLWGIQEKNMQAAQVSPWKRIVTLEDHLIDGGFGSWMLEALRESPDLLTRVEIKALDAKICGMVGKQATLNEVGGIEPAQHEK